MASRTRGRFAMQGLRRALAEPLVRARRKPFDAFVVLLALAASAYVVIYPFSVATFPPITDFPFHASATSILRHYWDPAWGFQKQFTLHPLEVPYMSHVRASALCSRWCCRSTSRPRPPQW